MSEQATQNSEAEKPSPTPTDPVRKWTFIIFALCIVLMVLYLVADRKTPFTTQAKVHAYVVPISSQVSGKIISVDVSNNEFVNAGQQLFRIDPSNYQLAVDAAEASLQAALQSVDAGAANVEAAEAKVESAKANVWRSEQDAVRMRRIQEEDPGAISQRRIDSAEATLATALGQLAATEASLESARKALGETDENNAQIKQAQAALNQTRIDLERTVVVAPSEGLVTDLRIDQGNFAGAGAPLMTFIAIHNVWVRADLTENNLGNVDVGDKVELTFDVQPGKIFKGRVRDTGLGVQVDTNALGTLPTIENDRSWLRDAQRFPVAIDFDRIEVKEKLGLRVGSQVSVIVYTDENWLMNLLGKMYIRVHALLSYVF
jgi:multidrug resistance efflux pump